MKEKHWISYTNIDEEEEWLADSGATAHMTNTCSTRSKIGA